MERGDFLRVASRGFMHGQWVHIRPRAKNLVDLNKVELLEKEGGEQLERGVRGTKPLPPCTKAVAHKGRAKLTVYVYR